MRGASLFLCLFFCYLASAGHCNNGLDTTIYIQHGSELPSKMRSLIGWSLFLSKEDFTTRVHESVGFSMPCSTCYGDMYACTRANCKATCLWKGDSCDACLETHQCSQALRECTGLAVTHGG